MSKKAKAARRAAGRTQAAAARAARAPYGALIIEGGTTGHRVVVTGETTGRTWDDVGVSIVCLTCQWVERHGRWPDPEKLAIAARRHRTDPSLPARDDL